MINLATIVSKFENNINAEVNALRDDANNKIGPREVARSMINKFLPDFPMIVKGTHLVTYIDDRGEPQIKEQDKNLSLWLVALQTTLESGYTSVGGLGRTFSNWAKDALSVEWAVESAVIQADIYIKVMQRNGLINTELEFREYENEDGSKGQAKVFNLSVGCLEAIVGETKKMREHSVMVCKPLRNQPEDWLDAVTGVGELANMRLVKNQLTKTTVIHPSVLEAVNKLQHVEFRIADCMVDAAEDILDNEIGTLTKEEVLMYKEMETMRGRTCFFPVTLDQRGRMYYRGGLLTPQGTDFCKAAFQFAKGEALGPRGLEAVEIHLANTLGADKLSIMGRLEYVNAHGPELFEIKDHLDIVEYFPKADKFQALVAVLEWQRIQKLSESVPVESIVSTLVCHQDGTCNGLQHMSAITGDRKTAQAVNCTASDAYDEPEDIYGIIAQAAKVLLSGDAQEILGRHGRNLAKDPVMLSSYGAGEDTVTSNIAKFLKEKGEDTSKTQEIADAIFAALASEAGAVKTLTEALKRRMKQCLASGATKLSWTTFDGFEAATEYRDMEVNRVRAGKFNALVRTMFPAPLDEVKTTGAMAPNFVHSIDAAHLREVVRQCDWELVTVHDSIGSLPSRFHDTKVEIQLGFVKAHSYDAIGNLCESNGVRAPKFRGDYKATEALNSTYIFS